MCSQFRTPAWALAGVLLALHASAQTPAPDYQPTIERALVQPDVVRPGDELSVELWFKNIGADPAPRDQLLLIHLEMPVAEGCGKVALERGRTLGTPTTMWSRGMRIVDGPRLLPLPENLPEGEYMLHVGLLDRLDGMLVDTRIGPVRVNAGAVATEDRHTELLPPSEVARRKAALSHALFDPLTLESAALSFALDRESGAFVLRLGNASEGPSALWASHPEIGRFGRARLAFGTREVEVPVGHFDAVRRDGKELVAVAPLLIQDQDTGARVELRASMGDDGLRLALDTKDGPEWKVTSLIAFEQSFLSTDSDGARLVLPRHLGIEQRADTGLPVTRAWSTGGDLSMGMCGLIQDSGALLLTWSHPAVTLWTHVTDEQSRLIPGRRAQSLSLEIPPEHVEFLVRPLRDNKLATLARAYREVLLADGRLERDAPERNKSLDGAARFRLVGLNRYVPGTRYNPGTTEKLELRMTFDEMSRCARHWREDLAVDRAFVIVCGWNRAGYDNEYPDVLPANEQCGGDTGLAALGHALHERGYVYGLHDNYLDAYPSAPSYDPEWISVDNKGALLDHSEWMGGKSYRICPRVALGIARRNWREMKARYAPDAVYLDTAFIVPLGPCFSKTHPLTIAEDLQARRGLCQRAHEFFPIVGSEGGREWGVGAVDYFGGLLTHRRARENQRNQIPLFPMVFGNRVALGSMVEDRIGVGSAAMVLDHALFAEMPTYDTPDHAYFESGSSRAVPLKPLEPIFKAVDKDTFEMTYRWRVGGKVDRDYRMFVHFIHAESTRAEHVSMQDDYAPPVPTSRWEPGIVLEVGAHRIAIKEPLEGNWEVWTGLFDDGGRASLEGISAVGGRYHIGTLTRRGGQLSFHALLPDEASVCFARADGGWAAGMLPIDRVIKNTWELLSPLDRITADRTMDSYEALDALGEVERTTFGDVQVVINRGDVPFEQNGTVLGRHGVLIEGPTFVAFHALRHAGIDYPGGALFVIEARDGFPLDRSKRVRIYHGFGPKTVRVGDQTVEVERETVLKR